MAGRDLLACAMTGSGKTAAFLLPILHQLIDRPRGTTRALVLTPTRELAAQIVEDLNDLAVHTPLTAAAVFGGVGMGPQEHAFRSGVDVIVGTPGRLLDHFRAPYAKLTGLEFLVLDEADRMLDMGFLPDIRRVLRHLPTRRQTLFFSATMPPPIAELSREMLHKPATINLERRSVPAVGHHAGGVSGAAAAEGGAAARAAASAARCATRWCSRGRSIAPIGWRGISRSTGEGAAHSRQSIAGAAHRGARRVQERPVPGAGGDRHRRARHRRRPRSATSSTSTCRRSPKTTFTASGGRRAPS